MWPPNTIAGGQRNPPSPPKFTSTRTSFRRRHRVARPLQGGTGAARNGVFRPKAAPRSDWIFCGPFYRTVLRRTSSGIGFLPRGALLLLSFSLHKHLASTAVICTHIFKNDRGPSIPLLAQDAGRMHVCRV